MIPHVKVHISFGPESSMCPFVICGTKAEVRGGGRFPTPKPAWFGIFRTAITVCKPSYLWFRGPFPVHSHPFYTISELSRMGRAFFGAKDYGGGEHHVAFALLGHQAEARIEPQNLLPSFCGP